MSGVREHTSAELSPLALPTLTSQRDSNLFPDTDTQKRLAEEKKEEGNQPYKVKSYREALAKYSEAMDLCPQCASFYGNRSACYLMLGQPRQALEDAKTSTSQDPVFEKGWTRLARCCALMGDAVTARQTLSKLGELGGTERGRTEERGLGGETQSRRTAGLPVRRLQALFVVHRQGVGSIDPFLVIEGVPGRVFGLPGEIFRGLGDGQHSASV